MFTVQILLPFSYIKQLKQHHLCKACTNDLTTPTLSNTSPPTSQPTPTHQSHPPTKPTTYLRTYTYKPTYPTPKPSTYLTTYTYIPTYPPSKPATANPHPPQNPADSEKKIQSESITIQLQWDKRETESNTDLDERK